MLEEISGQKKWGVNKTCSRAVVEARTAKMFFPKRASR
jgi:hypothetical protein